jgi:hypothetical protein
MFVIYLLLIVLGMTLPFGVAWYLTDRLPRARQWTNENVITSRLLALFPVAAGLGWLYGAMTGPILDPDDGRLYANFFAGFGAAVAFGCVTVTNLFYRYRSRW